MDVRRQWMEIMGIPAEEIKEYCDGEQYPTTLAAELTQLEAAKRIKENNDVV